MASEKERFEDLLDCAEFEYGEPIELSTPNGMLLLEYVETSGCWFYLISRPKEGIADNGFIFASPDEEAVIKRLIAEGCSLSRWRKPRKATAVGTCASCGSTNTALYASNARGNTPGEFACGVCLGIA